MLELYNKVEKFVIDSYTKLDRTRSIPHFKRTVYWVKELKPDADEAILMAAIAHDIERAYSDDYKKLDKGFIDQDYLKKHSRIGAEIIKDFLEKPDAKKEIVDKVYRLILKHEHGGREDENLIKDADSISYFENNAEHFVINKVSESSK